MQDLLTTDLMYLPGIGPQRKALLLSELRLNTWGDLLECFPYKYIDRSRLYTIAELTGDMPYVQVRGRILFFETHKLGPAKEVVYATFTDGTGMMTLTWFNGGKWAKTHYIIGKEYIVFGQPTMWNGRIQVQHPEIDAAESLQLSEMALQPHYPLTEKLRKRGFLSRTLGTYIRTLIGKLTAPLPETLPADIVRRYEFLSRDEALRAIHFPKTPRRLAEARRRLKFEELFFVQLAIVKHSADHRRVYHGYVFRRIGEAFNTFYRDNLPFALTGAQKRVMHEIRDDMATGRQMNRLLQGDVGSGKTLVALMAMLIAIDNGHQACIMAPTEILAEQHLTTLRQFLHGMSVRVELLTGSVKGKQRKGVLAALAAGEVDILVGTHAVIEDKVAFRSLGFVVIDEQHRFGVRQRAKLWGKSDYPPHILVMTATPIPRTLAMTLYGDLDVSVVDELPPGRKPIATSHVWDSNITSLYAGLRRQIEAGRQAYIVFPLIKESESLDLKNLEAGYEALCDVFPDLRLSMVHGKMKPQEKEEQMRRFVLGETQILVSTTVIEVGVNVPNASVMVIMDAQRFGLAQLHQLRGRVGRGADQSYCILVTGFKLSRDTRKRIDIMCQTCDGFRIAEADLKLRGQGDIDGTRQSGMAFDLKIASLARDGQLMQAARDEARRIVEADPEANAPANAIVWQRLQSLQKSGVWLGAIS